MDEPEKCLWAAAYQNQDIICVISRSGYRSCAYDPRGNEIVLGVDADDDALGIAVKNALAGSRFLSLDELPEFFDYRRCEEKYEKWVASLIEAGGYETRTTLFRYLKHCGITLSKGAIRIRPTIHETLETWGREKNDGIEDVFIPVESTPKETGSALRLGFSRCVG
ncbi:MAG TPA: contact-dependent growth inhibition system immunity protein [Chthoniobacteraceae bacterium]|jgi:hypothetical protein|nr:contact-dependent growth inhibition system immunity protein [Chthoniobacteraceae bacterium]